MTNENSDFDCPLCCYLMEPPINVCRNGHNLCLKCYTKLHHCPYCFALKPFEIDVEMERIFALKKFPCKYQHCRKIVEGRNMLNHHARCHYKPRRCPLNIYNCNWRGNNKRLARHFMDNHKRNYSEINNSVSLFVNTGNRLQQNVVAAFQCFGKYFLVAMDYSIHHNYAQFSVFLIDDDNNNHTSYTYQIEFKTKSTSKNVFFKAACQIFENQHNEDLFEKNGFLRITFDDVGDFLFNEDLWVEVKLLEN